MKTLAGLTLALVSCAAAVDAQVVEYAHLDAIGSVRAVTDGAGRVLERHDYLPFGEEWNPAPPRAETLAQRYTGKERDLETGLDYFGARYYGARLARFTTVDPLLDQETAILDPQRWNRYAYGRNNPYRYVDPDGKDVWDVVNGAANAFGSNFWFGSGRQTGNSDYELGQFIGDVASIVVGGGEAAGGLGLAAGGATVFTGGAAGTVVTGGGGSPVTVPVAAAGGVAVVVGGAMVVHGGTAAVSGSAHAGIYLAKKLDDLTGGGKTGRKLSRDRLAHQQETVDRLRGERDALRSKRNKTPADKEALEAKERELKREVDRLSASEEHARKGQGSN
jgi:RHS repeat-associated protein